MTSNLRGGRLRALDVMCSYTSTEAHISLQHRLHCWVSEGFVVTKYLRHRFNTE